MKPYPLELRERIMEAVEAKERSQSQIAATFSVTKRFITKLVRQKRELGHVAPLPHGGGRQPIFDQADRERLRAELTKRPDLTLKEIQKKVHPHNCRRERASTSAICRTLKAMKLVRKKKDGSAC